jgi:hypothetical protein
MKICSVEYNCYYYDFASGTGRGLTFLNWSSYKPFSHFRFNHRASVFGSSLMLKMQVFLTCFWIAAKPNVCMKIQD